MLHESLAATAFGFVLRTPTLPRNRGICDGRVPGYFALAALRSVPPFGRVPGFGMQLTQVFNLHSKICIQKSAIRNPQSEILRRSRDTYSYIIRAGLVSERLPEKSHVRKRKFRFLTRTRFSASTLLHKCRDHVFFFHIYEF